MPFPISFASARSRRHRGFRCSAATRSSHRPSRRPTMLRVDESILQLAFCCGSLIGDGSRCPPSSVFRMAPAVKFSSATNPTRSSRNWIFHPHSPSEKALDVGHAMTRCGRRPRCEHDRLHILPGGHWLIGFAPTTQRCPVR